MIIYISADTPSTDGGRSPESGRIGIDCVSAQIPTGELMCGVDVTPPFWDISRDLYWCWYPHVERPLVRAP